MIDRLPSLQALRTFAVAAREMSFRRAADALHLTPSAVSHAIRGLERELGVPLFRRTSHGLALTEAGVEYHRTVDGAFEALARGTAALRGRRAGPGITLNVVHTFAANWLIQRLPGFHAQHPEVDLSIRIRASADAVDFDPGRIELAIRFGIGEWPELARWRLMPCHTFPVCSPAVAARLADPRDLARETLIHVSIYPQAWDEWLEHAGHPGLRGAADLQYEDSEIRHRAAMSGLGVAMGIDCLVQNYLATQQLAAPFPIHAPIRRAYWLLALPEHADEPRVAAFRRWLLAEARGGESDSPATGE